MIDKLNFEKMNGLVPAVIQDARTNQVLMVGFMNREALEKTLSDKKVTFYSRTKKRLWQKGETSGNFQLIKAVFIDCDNDTILLQVKQIGEAACHTGYRSCFYRKLNGENFVAIGEKVFNPEEVYK